MPAQCRPEDYLTIEQHEIICTRNRDSILSWAHQVADDSAKDREHLHYKVDSLRDYIPKFQWWLVGLLVSIIIMNILGPRYFTNGRADVKAVQDTITAIESKQARQEVLSQQNNENLKIIMKKLGTRGQE